MKQKLTVYYDETELKHVQLCGHVLYFVPSEISATYENHLPIRGNYCLPIKDNYCYSPSEELLKIIYKIRETEPHNKKFHFKKFTGKYQTKYDRPALLLMAALVDSLRSARFGEFNMPLHCKLAIMYYGNKVRKNYYGGDTHEQKIRYDETMLRILLKSALHYFYKDGDDIVITDFIVDGKPNSREMDKHRVVQTLLFEEHHQRTPLRKNIQIDPTLKIKHISSDHKDHLHNTIEYEHANLLQCADLLLGAANYTFYPPANQQENSAKGFQSSKNKKQKLSIPFDNMICKLKRRGGFVNSSHFKSFTVSNISFEQDKIIFKNHSDLIAPEIEKPAQTEILFDTSLYLKD